MTPTNILLVEDNPSDVHLTRQALRQSAITGRLHVVEDGERALRFLRREGPYVEAPRPDLILLDLNLPGMDGRRVLEEIKADSELRRIPVVILTHSTAEADIGACYDRFANCYIVKPVDFDSFEAAVRSIERFWFRSVTLPPRS